MDHNSYGSSWLADYYPGTKVPSDASFRLMHLYHGIFYDHRGIYHQLGYGHGGKVIPEFAPALDRIGAQQKDCELGPVRQALRTAPRRLRFQGLVAGARGRFRLSTCRSIRNGRRRSSGGENPATRPSSSASSARWSATSARRAGPGRGSRCSSTTRSATRRFPGTATRRDSPKTTSTSSSTAAC